MDNFSIAYSVAASRPSTWDLGWLVKKIDTDLWFTANQKLYKYDGSTFTEVWDAAAVNSEFIIRSIEKYGTDYFIGLSGNSGLGRIYKYDGSTFTLVWNIGYDSVDDLVVFGGNLWGVVNVGGVSYAVLKYDGSNFTTQDTASETYRGLTVYNSELYLNSDVALYKLVGSSFETASADPVGTYITVFDNKIFGFKTDSIYSFDGQNRVLVYSFASSRIAHSIIAGSEKLYLLLRDLSTDIYTLHTFDAAGNLLNSSSESAKQYVYTFKNLAVFDDHLYLLRSRLSGFEADQIDLLVSDFLVDNEPLITPGFELPKIQSVRFVKEGTPQNFENTLFENMSWGAVQNPGYKIKLLTSDEITVQWRTDAPVSVVRLFDSSDQQVGADISATKTVDNTGINDVQNVWLQNGGSNQTTVIFAAGQLPEWAIVGQSVDILNTDIDGTYDIVSVDEFAGTLNIDATYTPATQTVAGTISVTYDKDEFDVYEATVNFTTQGATAGEYYLKIVLGGAGYEDVELISEPIDLQNSHPGTLIIQCTNQDNAFGVDYSNDIMHLFRVPGVFRRTSFPSTKSVMRAASGSLIKLRSRVNMQVLFQTDNLPYWLHRFLAIAFEHDYFSINGVEYQTEDQYSVEHIDYYSLAPGSITLELVETDNINSTDSGGSVEPSGTVLEINGKVLSIDE